MYDWSHKDKGFKALRIGFCLGPTLSIIWKSTLPSLPCSGDIIINMVRYNNARSELSEDLIYIFYLFQTRKAPQSTVWLTDKFVEYICLDQDPGLHVILIMGNCFRAQDSPGENIEPKLVRSPSLLFCLDFTARHWLPSILSPGELSRANYLVRTLHHLILKLKYCL